jgi:hypothetical protein
VTLYTLDTLDEKQPYSYTVDDDYCSFATTIFYRNKCSARLSHIVIKDHVTRLPLIFKQELCKLKLNYRQNTMGLFSRTWKPRGKMYSLKCNQCGEGFLSSYQLEAPICGKCLQKAKSLDSTIDHEKQCLTCGAQGVIYRKEYCYSCYFGFGKK